jgi:homoserine kinase
VDRHRIVSVEGEASTWPTDGDNLFLRAFTCAVDRLGLVERALPAMDFTCASTIPVARGLGSSGAAIAAGMLLARALARQSGQANDVDDHTLAHWACELEGHPDNTTASLFGGCTLALPGEGHLHVIHAPVHPSIAFAVAWPRTQVTTAEARAVLPTSVPFADAVENPRRLAFLLEGLRTGDGELLQVGLADRLHVEHRLPLTPGGVEAIEAAVAAGAHGATLSGSGSALVALCPSEIVVVVAEAMETVLQTHSGQPAAGHVLSLVTDAPRVS